MLKITNPLFLTIDGGGTKTKVTISTYSTSHQPDLKLSPTIQILSTGTHRSSNYSDLGIHSAIQSITQAVQIALQSLSLTWTPNTISPFTKIWAGLSGVDSPSDIKIMHQAISKLFALDSASSEPSCVKVSNDCDLLAGPIEFHYHQSKRSGSKLCQGGIVLIAGTGSIATAYIPDPHANPSNSLDSSVGLRVLGRLGGYGYLIGDEGSAYDVGKRTMKAILEYSDTLDSKEPDPLNLMISKSPLLPMILDHYGLESLGDLLGSVYKLDQSKHETEHHRKIRVAEVSRLVMRAAFPSTNQEEHPGDRFALKIMQETSHELSQLLRKICKAHQLVPDQMVLSLGGGMWAYDQFRELLLETTRTEWDAKWGWVERVNEPDEVAAITLVNRYLKNQDS